MDCNCKDKLNCPHLTDSYVEALRKVLEETTEKPAPKWCQGCGTEDPIGGLKMGPSSVTKGDLKPYCQICRTFYESSEELHTIAVATNLIRKDIQAAEERTNVVLQRILRAVRNME